MTAARGGARRRARHLRPWAAVALASAALAGCFTNTVQAHGGTAVASVLGGAAREAATSPRAAKDRADEQHLRVKAFTHLDLQRGDRDAIGRALDLARTELRNVSALSDELRSAAEPRVATAALALWGQAHDHLADMLLAAPSQLELSAVERLTRARLDAEADDLEHQARHARGQSSRAVARLLERAAGLRTRSVTMLQDAATRLGQQLAEEARRARMEAMFRYGLAAWVAHEGRFSTPETQHGLTRLVDPAHRDAVAAAMQKQHEFRYAPGLFEGWALEY